MALEGNIVVDWGTTNFRAWRFDGAGAIIDEHQAPAGILAVVDGAFEAMLEQQIGAWLAPGVTVLLSGMITSRNGWRETLYVETPARPSDLRRHAQSVVTHTGVNLLFLPGVCTRAPAPDVMRGEEIQVFGSVGQQETATVILPGTHSKWVRVEGGRLVSFRTFFTGEMFALLKNHSILARVPPEGKASHAAFLDGVGAAKTAEAGFLNAIFAVRAGALLQTFPPADAIERLSGVVIGQELRDALADLRPPGPIVLVGDPGLCERYRAALAVFGISARLGSTLATVDGFRKLAELA